MCYVVAKERSSTGCYALRTEHGEALVALKKKIPRKRGLQIVTISRPSAYGEYAPYVFAHSEEEFLKLVRTL